MLASAAALAFALATPAPAVAERRVVARTDEGRRVVLTIRRRTVVRVRVELRRYRCDVFGDIGPLHVDERVRARIGADGRFRIAAGEPAQRLALHGRLDRGRRHAGGRLKVRGTIATGQRCASALVRFR